MFQSTAGPQAHFVLEALAYLVGARIYWRTARTAVLPQTPERMLLLGTTIFFAFAGSKLLHVAEHFDYLAAQQQASLWWAGKSVLGGFIGGTLGAELGKKAIGWRPATGDAWVAALAVGLCIGRLGCQLSSTWDQTYGIATDLPWAWDYGDGIGRHPTAGYEIVLVALAFFALRRSPLGRHTGASFAAFMLLYCLIRLLVDFLKPPFGAPAIDTLPTDLYFGLTAIQWAALAGMAWFANLLRIRLHPQEGH